MKSLTKWFVVLAMPFAMGMIAVGGVASVGCTGPAAVDDAEADDNGGMSDDEYGQMMDQANQDAAQGN